MAKTKVLAGLFSSPAQRPGALAVLKRGCPLGHRWRQIGDEKGRWEGNAEIGGGEVKGWMDEIRLP